MRTLTKGVKRELGAPRHCGMRAILTAALGLSLTAPLFAAEPASQAVLRAALVLKTFDHYAAACQQSRGFDKTEARQVAAWEDAQDVQALREHLDDHPLPPGQQQELNGALAQVKAQPQLQRAHPCAAAVAVTKAPGSQFGHVVPGDGAGAGPAARPPGLTVATAPAAPPADTSKLLPEIDSFAFSTRAKMGLGGFIALDIYPVLLFKSGEALTNVRHLAEGGDKTSLQRRHGADFTRWRKSGGELQIQEKDGGWKTLPFQTTYARLPDGLKLDGLYRSTSGTGNVAVGGAQAVTAWEDYRFSPDGQVQRGGGAGSRAEAGNTSVATANRNAGRTGRYRVEGLVLQISYADGGSERRILIADPKDTKGTVWIDGEGYVRRER